MGQGAPAGWGRRTGTGRWVLQNLAESIADGGEA